MLTFESSFVPIEHILFKGADLQHFETLTHQKMEDAVRLMRKSADHFQTRDFATRSLDHAQFIASVFREVATTVFATGYPFYIMNDRLPNKFVIEEFDRFAHEQVAKAEMSVDGTWLCPTCVEEGNLRGDLKTLCKPCTRTKFPPRELYKLLPDVDISMSISGQLTKQALEEISHLADASGLQISDHASMTTLLGGNGIPIFVDLHVMSDVDLQRGLQEVFRRLDVLQLTNDTTDFAQPVNIPIASYRGHGVWNFDESLPLDFDLICSFFPMVWSTHNLGPLIQIYSQPERLLTLLETIASSRSPKITRMLQSENDRKLLADSISRRSENLQRF